MNKVRLSIIMAALSAAASCVAAQDADNPLERPPVPPPAPAAPTTPALPAPAALPGLPQELANEVRALDANQAQLARSARALADSHMKLAQAAAKEIPTAYGWSTGTPGGGTKRALVIPKDGAETKGVNEIDEDMGVMAHILDKAISNDGKTSRPMGITVFGLSSSGGGQNLFIEGYGAIFFESVNFPLLPPPSKEKDTEAKEKANTEWEVAKNELARPGRSGGDNFFVFEQDLDNVHWAGKGTEYDADKVEDLKKDLITALKNAANIRKLKSDETITVVVTGAKSGSGRLKTIYAPGAKAEPGTPKKVGSATADSGKLIIRARKSDTESFLNGKLNYDDFRKRATVLLY